ncbi:MAG TPA: hypothetical protein ENG40_04450 [Thermoprotei archaeon]|nr:hypothetical protein [Thermoprotei archaeon]
MLKFKKKLIFVAFYFLINVYIFFHQAFIKTFNEREICNIIIAIFSTFLFGTLFQKIKYALLSSIGVLFITIFFTIYIVRYPIDIFISSLSADIATLYISKNIFTFMFFIYIPLSIVFLFIGLYFSQYFGE